VTFPSVQKQFASFFTVFCEIDKKMLWTIRQFPSLIMPNSVTYHVNNVINYIYFLFQILAVGCSFHQHMRAFCEKRYNSWCDKCQ
jgi:hypothetical protein